MSTKSSTLSGDQCGAGHRSLTRGQGHTGDNWTLRKIWEWPERDLSPKTLEYKTCRSSFVYSFFWLAQAYLWTKTMGFYQSHTLMFLPKPERWRLTALDKLSSDRPTLAFLSSRQSQNFVMWPKYLLPIGSNWPHDLNTDIYCRLNENIKENGHIGLPPASASNNKTSHDDPAPNTRTQNLDIKLIQVSNTDHVTWILTSKFSILILWPEYWPLIGQYWSCDLNIGLWLVKTDHVTWILNTWPLIGQYWSRDLNTGL